VQKEQDSAGGSLEIEAKFHAVILSQPESSDNSLAGGIAGVCRGASIAAAGPAAGRTGFRNGGKTSGDGC
jgi:hypothetical protein